jgi:hypothetical protein
MALTATIVQRIDGIGPGRYVVIKAVGDTSYPTGGYPVTPALFGFSSFISDGLGTGLPPVAGSYGVLSDAMVPTASYYSNLVAATGNLQLLAVATGAEVTSATNVSAFQCYLEAYGT